ncbi:MAG: CoA transferase, partial [Hyphomicrobiaceae bacterium]
MSALEGLSIRIVGDHTESHYAGWLLAGLGASVEVVGTRPAVELSPTSQWLTSHASYRQAPAGAIAPHTVGADALIVDSGERLPEGRADELRAIRADAPALVLTSISPYGLSGPMAGRRATHQEAQAVAGLINETGFVDGPPVPVYGDIVRMATGANATLATLLGLWRRRRTRGGALVDLSVLETTVGLRSSWAYTYAYTGLVTRRSLVENIGHYLPCKDGYVHIYPATTSLDDLIRFLEIDESSIPAEVFPLDKSRQFSHPALLAIVRHAMSGITVDELVERGILWRIPVSPALTSDALVHDRHLEARGYFETARMGGAELRTPRYPFQGGIWRHEEPVDPGAARPAAPGSTGLPLEGIRVAEFGTAWSGPMCAEILALYGAEVIKVEAPERLDSGRANHYLDLIVRDPGYEFVYNSHPVNGGKLHFGLDINGPSGRATARRLTECLDILVTNISMRALTNLGMNGPAVQAVNPRCTVVHSTSAGLDGPYASLAGYGSGMELMTGLAAATAGAAGQPGMIRSQLLHPDIFGALPQATAAVAGHFRRERTGVGAIVDLSQFECGAVAGTRDLLRAQGAEEPQTAVA